jgi:hypothetical protein
VFAEIVRVNPQLHHVNLRESLQATRGACTIYYEAVAGWKNAAEQILYVRSTNWYLYMLIGSVTGWRMLRERESTRIQEGLGRTVHLDIDLLLRHIIQLHLSDNALVEPSW